MTHEDRRRGRVPRPASPVAVQEIIARTTLEPLDADGRCFALVDIELCLSDGRRVQARAEDRLRLEIDTSSALSVRAAVQSAVRAYLRRSLEDGSVGDWPALKALGRFGAGWSGEADQVDISVDMTEPAVTAD